MALWSLRTRLVSQFIGVASHSIYLKVHNVESWWRMWYDNVFVFYLYLDIWLKYISCNLCWQGIDNQLNGKCLIGNAWLFNHVAHVVLLRHNIHDNVLHEIEMCCVESLLWYRLIVTISCTLSMCNDLDVIEVLIRYNLVVWSKIARVCILIIDPWLINMYL